MQEEQPTCTALCSCHNSDCCLELPDYSVMADEDDDDDDV